MFRSLLTKTPIPPSFLKCTTITTQKAFKLNNHHSLSLTLSRSFSSNSASSSSSSSTTPDIPNDGECVNVSFYLFSNIENPPQLRDSLLNFWQGKGIKGRCYIAKEGINSQITVPLEQKDAVFSEELKTEFPFLKLIYLNYSHDKLRGFKQLKVLLKSQVLADGNTKVNLENTGEYVSPSEWDKLLEEMKAKQKKYLLLDVRNNYESEIGYFEGAIRPNVHTFKSSIPIIKEILKGKEDHSILMYCTGGIRCTKMSSILKDSGFGDVKQLRGGIVTYLREIKKMGTLSKFKGKNFVFDERLIEEGSLDIVGKCHHCGEPCDEPSNCLSKSCNAIIVMCPNCKTKLHGTCGQHQCMNSVVNNNENQPNSEPIDNNTQETSKDFSRRPHIKDEGLTLDEVKYPYLKNST